MVPAAAPIEQDHQRRAAVDALLLDGSGVAAIERRPCLSRKSDTDVTAPMTLASPRMRPGPLAIACIDTGLDGEVDRS
jgi:hypothetical protein